MPHSVLLEKVFPVLGVFLSNALYLAPAPAVYNAVRAGALGQFNVLPQAVMVHSTISWIFYALSVPNPYIAAANLPGAVAAISYAVFTLPLIPRERASERRAVQGVLVLGSVVTLIGWCMLIFGAFEPAKRSFILGLYGSLLCVLLFASPLSTVRRLLARVSSLISMALARGHMRRVPAPCWCAQVREVLHNSNAVSIYAPLTIAQCVNCGTWTLYGFAVGDIWVWGPNATGFVLGLIQVALKLAFPSHVETDGSAHRLVGTKQACSDEEDA